MTMASEALVLGAGVIGLSTAIRLAEDGKQANHDNRTSDHHLNQREARL